MLQSQSAVFPYLSTFHLTQIAGLTHYLVSPQKNFK